MAVPATCGSMPTGRTPSCHSPRSPTSGRFEPVADQDVLTVDLAVELVMAYLGAWTERRSGARRRLLQHCWSESGTFSSWTTHVQGIDAMDAHIAAAIR